MTEPENNQEDRSAPPPDGMPSEDPATSNDQVPPTEAQPSQEPAENSEAERTAQEAAPTVESTFDQSADGSGDDVPTENEDSSNSEVEPEPEPEAEVVSEPADIPRDAIAALGTDQANEETGTQSESAGDLTDQDAAVQTIGGENPDGDALPEEDPSTPDASEDPPEPATDSDSNVTDEVDTQQSEEAPIPGSGAEEGAATSEPNEAINEAPNDGSTSESSEGEPDQPEPAEEEGEPTPDASQESTADDSGGLDLSKAKLVAGDKAEPEETGLFDEETPVDDGPDPDELKHTVEALLFAADAPLTIREMARAAGSKSSAIRKLLIQIREEYNKERRPWQLAEVAEGFRFVTRPRHFVAVQKLKSQRAQRRLTQAALETLALIAYSEEPISRAEIENVRGVGAGPVLRLLLERRLIRIAGRGSGLGQPLLYSVTKEFLEHFGLRSTKELPRAGEFKGT